MSSEAVVTNKKHSGYSYMAKAIQQLAGQIGETTPQGLYGHTVEMITGAGTLSNSSFDMEFSIPFDDDTEANEAEMVVYNLKDTTINAIKKESNISVNAGYGNDTGVIFSGYISKVRTVWEDNDKVTIINAIDNNGKKETEVTNLTYNAGTKASAILKDLVGKVGLALAVFQTKRDHTYKDKVTISGGLMENIKKYAQICGVVAYVCKSKIYVCPLTYGTHNVLNLSADTGLLSTQEFEEEITAEDYTDTITGLNIDMLLQHKVQTGSIINVTSRNANGQYRVSKGSHEYDGTQFTTTVKAIAYSCLK